MTGKKEWFVSLDETIQSKVKFVDDNSLSAASRGKVLIKRRDRKHSFISDVLFVPRIKSNLLRLGQLLERGYVMKMENNEMRVYDGEKRLIIKAPLARNRTLKVGIQVMEHKCVATAISQEEWIWHYRFGHLNFKDLSML